MRLKWICCAAFLLAASAIAQNPAMPPMPGMHAFPPPDQLPAVHPHDRHR